MWVRWDFFAARAECSNRVRRRCTRSKAQRPRAQRYCVEMSVSSATSVNERFLDGPAVLERFEERVNVRHAIARERIEDVALQRG